jgi:hypothetical protein
MSMYTTAVVTTNESPVWIVWTRVWGLLLEIQLWSASMYATGCCQRDSSMYYGQGWGFTGFYYRYRYAPLDEVLHDE